MKNLVTTLVLVVVSLVSFSQADSVTVKTKTNEMTDVKSVTANYNLIASSDGVKGIKIQPHIDKKGISTLIVSQYKMGSPCNENSTLIIKFTDGTKIKIASWNKFDCDIAYFDPTLSNQLKLKTLEIEKIYYQNGRSYTSGTFPVENPRYFIQLYKGL